MESRRMYGPINPDCDLAHAEKYRGPNENFRESANRWSGFLQDSHEHYMAFREISINQRFLPPGRVQAGAGSLKNVTLMNCFVMSRIHDSFTEGPDDSSLGCSIMDVAKDAADTMRQGGGVGYDISTLRPRGDIIRGLQSITDGPLAFAPIYDAVCRATSSAGNRRGAQMLVLRIDHPDIEYFIKAKQAIGQAQLVHDYIRSEPDPAIRNSLTFAFSSLLPLRGFNISVAVTDEFMNCLSKNSPFPLQFNGQTYREVDPQSLWDMLMRGTYDWAEPGVLFIDTINRMNNLYYCEQIAASNPCGEQPLPPNGSCLLGSINTVKYLIKDGSNYTFNYDLMIEDIPHIVRAMDNVVDRSRYPLVKQKVEAQRKRRMGLGITGLANTIEAMGHPYGSTEFLHIQDEIMSTMTRECYRNSALLAKEKGPFPLYDEERYLNSAFIQSLDDDTIGMIKKYGIRNSHLTSIAPTGTISFTADNVSSGIEPVIDYEQTRRIIVPGGHRIVTVPDYGSKYLGVKGKTVMSGEITPDEHIGVLAIAQSNVDSAVSKTVNVPTETPFEEFKNLYSLAYEWGAKGCTTYRPNGNYDEPIKSSKKEQETENFPEAEACGFDPLTGAKTGACAD